MKRIMILMVVVVGFALTGIATAATPPLNIQPASCLNKPTTFSTNTQKYGVSVVEGVGDYVIHWWGALTCGTYESLVQLTSNLSTQGATFTAGERLFVVTVSNALPASLSITKVDGCEGLAKNKGVIHCWKKEFDDMNHAKMHAFLQTLSKSSNKFAFYASNKAAPAVTDLINSPEILLSTLLAQGKVLDADQDGIYDTYDNCPSVANADQADANNDGKGDACPELGTPPQDSDSDGVPDTTDKCVNDGGAAGTVNADGCLDTDQDGIADKDDACPKEGTAGQIGPDGCPTATTPSTDSTATTPVEAAGDGGSCALVGTGTSSAGWLLMIAGLVPLWLRRRS